MKRIWSWLYLYAIHQGAGEIVVFGALGARWDMTLANLMLLTHPALKHTQLSLVDGNQEISLLRGGQSIQLHGKQGDTISLIPLSPDSIGNHHPGSGISPVRTGHLPWVLHVGSAM